MSELLTRAFAEPPEDAPTDAPTEEPEVGEVEMGGGGETDKEESW